MSILQSRLLRYSLMTLGALFAMLLTTLTLITLAIYTESGSRRVTLAAIDRANQLEGIQLRVNGISGNLLSGLTLSGLSAEIPGVTIDAQSVRASWNPYSLFSGSFYLSELGISDLTVTLPAADPAAPPTEIIPLLRINPPPINLAIAALEVDRLRIVLPDQTLALEQLALNAQLDGNELLVRSLHAEQLPLVLDIGLQAQLTDDIPIVASINWEYRGALFANYQLAVGRTAVTGDLTSLDIQHELLAPEAIHSTGVIDYPVSDALRTFSFMHHTDRLVLPFAGFENLLFEDASLLTEWSGAEVDLELQSQVTQSGYPPVQVVAAGVLDGSTLALTAATLSTETGTADLSGNLDWSDAFEFIANFSVNESAPLQYFTSSLPIDLTDVAAAGVAQLSNDNNQQNITVVIDEFSGITSGYDITGQANVTFVDGAVQIQSLKLNTDANSISVTGEYQDQIRLNWQLDVPVLSQLLTDTEGVITGSGGIAGSLDNPVVTATIEGSNLRRGDITVSNAAFSVDGTLEQLRSNAQISNVAMQSGGNVQLVDNLQLEAEGGMARHTARASLDSPYGSLVVAVNGGINNATPMVWQGTLDEASVRSEFGNWQRTGSAVPMALSSDSVQIPEICWLMSQTELCVEARQAVGSRVAIAATLAGLPLTEFTAPAELQAPLISHELFPRLPAGLALNGTASAQINGEVDLAGGAPSLEFALAANDAVLTIANTEAIDPAIATELQRVDDQRYYWDTLTLNGQWVNNIWSLAGLAALSQQNIDGSNLGLHGEIDSTLTIGEDGSLNGRVTTNFAELGWIQAFVPELTAVSGSLVSAIDISGDLTTPLVAGELNLQNGSAEVSLLGITLSNIESTISAQTSGQVQLDGRLTSGEGDLSFSGTIVELFDDTRSLQATLSGSNVLLADIPNVRLAITPDVTMTADSSLIRLNGSLDIPLLDLTLLELPETAADVSRDAVVVNYPASKPELAYSVASSQSRMFDIPVAADINLTLGDSVAVSGFGMSATLDGDLSIQQRADGRNLTYGELSIVEGNYEIYGQSLDLRQGKLLFFGAIDNPALDIRAVRETENVTVGVLMNGTLKNIRSQLFSTPTLPDNDIIAVLVTGRPYSELGEQDGTAVLGTIAALGLDRGEGLTDQIRNTLGLDTLGINSTGNINSSVLTIGKYLTPDIFVRYGVGLFDHQSKVAIDYTLTPRIMLQAESGEYQSIDLTYTIER